MAIGSVPSLIVGVGAGAAASAAFEPALEVPKQLAWKDAPHRLPDVALIAQLVATGKVSRADGEGMAARLGYDTGPFSSLLYLAQSHPDFPLMLRLWRRFPHYTSPNGTSVETLLDESMAHSGLDWNYHELLKQLQTAELPGIGDIAYSVVRGYLPTDINLPVAPPATSDYVPRFPQSKTLAEDLAVRLGYDKAMLELMIARSGLSMAPVMAANALFRSNAAVTMNALPDVPGVAAFNVQPYVGDNDYALAISEGDLRTEWADAVRETSRQILTAGEYAELELRGYLTRNQRRALTHQHGMRDFDSDLLYDVQGRAPSIRQVYIGLARGAKYDGTPQTIPSPYLESAQRSNLRPEWYSIAYENRYSLPSAFVVRALLRDGAITEDRGSTILQHQGWPAELADLVAKHYAAPTTAGTDPHVAKAQTQLWTTTHSAYKNGEVDQAEVTRNLTTLGVPAAAQTQVLTLWNAERDTYRKQLTPTQLKKAWRGAAINPATGAAWTKDEVLAALIARGYSPNDANTFLEL